MATIYSNTMSGAWKSRIGREEKYLLEQMGVVQRRPPSAPAHQNAPFATDMEVIKGKVDVPQAQPSSTRPGTAKSMSGRTTSRASVSSNAMDKSAMPTKVGTRKLVPPGTITTDRSEPRCETAMSVRSNTTATTVGTTEISKSGALDTVRPGTSKSRTAGISSDFQLQKKLANLEKQVHRERDARVAMEKQVKALREEVCSDHGRSTARSKVTVKSVRASSTSRTSVVA